MKRTLLLCLAATLAVMGSQAATFGNESLNYEIVYQWGMIWKHAGDATFSLRKTSQGYTSTLTARTRSWADKVYPVRDTLRCTLNSSMQPLRYEKLTHEKTYYARDVLDFSYNYSHTSAVGKRYRKGRDVATVNLSAKCQAYDMLSVFYMLRSLDFRQLSPTRYTTTVVFSGKAKEYLNVRYKGVETIKLRNGTKREAHHLIFKFTQEAGKKSSDDLDAWLATYDTHIPLMLVGHLPVGQVKCYYAP